MFLLTSQSCFHFFHSAQVKDTPIEAFVFTQILDLWHGFKKFQQVLIAFNASAYWSCTCPFNYNSNFLPFCHQSSTSTPYRKHSHKEYIACHSVVMGTVETKYNNYQFKQENTLSFDIDYVRKKTCLHSFEFPFLSFLAPSKVASLLSTSHPLPSIALCRWALYNTQTNKFSYPSSQVFLKLLLL